MADIRREFIKDYVNNLMEMYGPKGSLHLRQVLALTAIWDSLSVSDICRMLDCFDDKAIFIKGIMNDLRALYNVTEDGDTVRYDLALDVYKDYIKDAFADDVNDVKMMY